MIFSVIIPTCNRNDLLDLCLAKLKPEIQTIDPDIYEVIVSDDSRDNMAKQLIDEKYTWVKWIEGPKRGPASNRNNGAKQAKCDWLIFIDDDCLPEKSILENYRIAITQYPDSLAFEGSILPDDWNLMKKETAECPINTNGNAFWSANICVQKKLFFSIKGFDEQFILAAQEDEDLYRRIRNLTTVTFLKNCIVVHPVRFISVKKKISGMKKQFKNYLYFFKKHGDTSVKKHLLKSVVDYAKMSVNDIFRFRLKLFTLHILNSFYCFYLFFTYKES